MTTETGMTFAEAMRELCKRNMAMLAEESRMYGLAWPTRKDHFNRARRVKRKALRDTFTRYPLAS
jgi:hypothetical protein